MLYIVITLEPDLQARTSMWIIASKVGPGLQGRWKESMERRCRQRAATQEKRLDPGCGCWKTKAGYGHPGLGIRSRPEPEKCLRTQHLQQDRWTVKVSG